MTGRGKGWGAGIVLLQGVEIREPDTYIEKRSYNLASALTFTQCDPGL